MQDMANQVNFLLFSKIPYLYLAIRLIWGFGASWVPSPTPKCLQELNFPAVESDAGSMSGCQHMSSPVNSDPADPLFADSFGPDDRWMVLRTKSRQEKAVASDLQARDLLFMLPLTRRVRYIGRRKIEIDVPLFPGYLFLRGSADQAYEIDRTRRIASILAVADQAGLNSELHGISLAIANRISLNPYPYLSVGKQVEVRAGPLRGLRGRVETLKAANNRLVINVEMLGRAVSLEIDGSLLDVL